MVSEQEKLMHSVSERGLRNRFIMMTKEELEEKQLSSELIYDGVVVHLYKDQVSIPGGGQSIREVVRHVGAVCVVPYEDGMVYMERQYRYPFEEVLSEIPAGKLDYSGEDLLQAAKRELREETGLTAGKWTDLGPLYPTVAYTDERIELFMAEDLHPGQTDLDEDEFIDVYKVPLKDVLTDVMDGKVPDGKTQIAILKAARLKGL